MTDSKTVVIVAPHPDDAELALGGTIIKLIEAEWEVVLIDLTDGEPTPWGSKEQRARETAKASALLGVGERACLGMPNRYLEASLENRRVLARVLRERKPGTVFGPGASDAHPDHTEAARLVEVSCFEARLHQTDVPGEPHRVDRIYNYQPIHRLSCEKPLFVVDVTRVWDRKVAAIEAYESQLKNGPRGGGSSWIDRVEAVCRYYGELAGCRYAEPFFGAASLGPRDLSLIADLHTEEMHGVCGRCQAGGCRGSALSHCGNAPGRTAHAGGKQGGPYRCDTGPLKELPQRPRSIRGRAPPAMTPAEQGPSKRDAEGLTSS